MSIASSMSGLTSAARAIDIIGNNIANSQTIGFKTSQAQFANVLAAASAGSETSDAGSGVSAAIINQRFTQGSLNISSNPLDMAISGLGFFRLDNDGALSYTRDGQFRLTIDPVDSSKRVLVNSSGYGVTGYLAEFTSDPQGTIVKSGAPKVLSVDTVMPALATSNVALGASLDARVLPPAVVPFAATDERTFNNRIGVGVFDSTGASHNLEIYFGKSAPGNLWEVHTTLDNSLQTGPVGLDFDTDGKVVTAMPLPQQTYSLPSGEALSVSIDLTGTVQYGFDFSIDGLFQDGYAEGFQDGNSEGFVNASAAFSVGTDGVIEAFYSNGQSRKVAQLVLASFNNPNALFSIGDNQWIENKDPILGSGAVNLDTPGGSTMGLGQIQANATEQSNVDLSNELVALIEQQRNYQASAQTFKILDQVLQKLQNATQG